MRLEGLAERAGQTPHERRDGRWRVLGKVADPQPAPQVEFGKGEIQFQAHLGHELHHGAGGEGEGFRVEDLRPDVGVEPAKFNAGDLQRRSDRLHRRSVRQAETELRIDSAGLDRLVRVRLDARGDGQQDRGLGLHLPGQPVEQLQFVEVVHDDPADALDEREAQFLFRLVIAVEVQRRAGDAPPPSGVDLAAGGDVDV